MKKLDCSNTNSRMWTGLVVLVVGLVFFLKNIGINIPDWLISWPTLLVAFGMLIGYKMNFRGIIWLVMILLGVVFTLEQAISFDLSKYYYAIVFIVIGMYMIFKPKSSVSRRNRCRERWDRKMKEKYAHFSEMKEKYADFNEKGSDFKYSFDKGSADINQNDILDSVNVFSGSHQNLYSKSFKGGDVVAIFGGADINLTQTDFEGTIKLDIVAIFGGVKIVIPPGWEVKSEIVAVFGGIDDKRSIGALNSETRKILIIDGVALFGGVDIRTF